MLAGLWLCHAELHSERGMPPTHIPARQLPRLRTIGPARLRPIGTIRLRPIGTTSLLPIGPARLLP